MSQETVQPPLGLGLPAGNAIDPDLVPMYALQERDYHRIVNGLANLMVGALQVLRGRQHEGLARELARRGSAILAGYDPDVAELVGNEALTSLAEEVSDAPAAVELAIPFGDGPDRHTG